jgi:hypothetical protein
MAEWNGVLHDALYLYIRRDGIFLSIFTNTWVAACEFTAGQVQICAPWLWNC